MYSLLCSIRMHGWLTWLRVTIEERKCYGQLLPSVAFLSLSLCLSVSLSLYFFHAPAFSLSLSFRLYLSFCSGCSLIVKLVFYYLTHSLMC